MCTLEVPLERLHLRRIRVGIKQPAPKELIGVGTYERDETLGDVLRVDVVGEDLSFLFQKTRWQGSIREGCSGNVDFEIEL